MADSQVKTANICNITSSTVLRPNAGGSGTYIADNSISVHMTSDSPASGIYIFSLPEQGVIGDKYTISFVPVCVTNNVMYVVLYGTTTRISFTSGNRYTLTITATGADNTMAFYGADNVEKTIIIKDIQIEKGETATVYRPYSATGWQHSLRELKTATETIQSGDTIYADGTAATVSLKGNTVQNGTPTPQNPVMPNGVGERTAQLFDYQSGTPTPYKYLDENGNEIEVAETAPWYITDYIPVPDGVLSVTLSKIGGGSPAMCAYDASKNYITGIKYDTGSAVTKVDITLTSLTPIRFIRFSYFLGNAGYDDISTKMLNSGSTAKPYEPYGYKIPILNGQQTTTIYLGSTQITRKITKYTFTGNETTFSCVATTDGQNYCVVYRFIDFGMTDIKDFDKIMQDIDYPIFISTHFEEKPNTNSDFNNIQPNQVGGNTVSAAGNRYIIFCVSGLTTAAEYSAWFAQQYANGTPVEVYYILETATTAAVNEPLMKIGDYVDTLSNAAQIPTTDGANSITVDTTVQPSEFTVTWTGWHNAYVKEKSRNLFDKSTAMQGKQYNEYGKLVDATDNWFATDFIKVIGGSTYIRSANGVAVGNLYNEYDINKNFIGQFSGGTGNPFTVSNSASYITFSINSISSPINSYMLNTGSTANPYEPYWK